VKDKGIYSANYSSPDLKPGIYFISLRINNKNFVKKFIYIK
ncbi:MAG TPA: T9SS type A sorting domain-containing protein, partial [Candidatus Omnitrophica bacterium]|nr:T9SS type A sorting domain-containing protein [Candidatus Omnitrophota bacterium]